MRVCENLEGMRGGRKRPVSEPALRKIRVCHLAVGDAWGGAEAHLCELLRWLVKDPGLDVTAIVLNEGRLAEAIRGLSVTVYVVPESDLSLGASFGKIFRIFHAFPVDLIHTHKPKDNVLGVLAGMLTCRPYVVRTVHGSPEMFSGMQYLKMILHELPNQFCNKFLVDRVIVVSKDLETRLARYYGGRKIVCIHNGIGYQSEKSGSGKSDIVKIRSTLGVTHEEYLLGSVGRLTAVKGHEFLIRAVALLNNDRGRKPVKAVLVGDGPLRKNLEELAFHLGVGNHVSFVGHQDDPSGFLQAMDVFVLPSLSEGIPLALLEAMAASQPIVAARVGGIPEIIEHGENGLLVEPANEHDIAKACDKLRRDRVFAARLGSAAHLKVTGELSSKSMADSVIAVYGGLVMK
ncbi:MAG: glycosyltransferase family 4 protein [Nitrospira sp.]|nr:glycosyltransferase family 4 protein [Nitrospira sp.]